MSNKDTQKMVIEATLLLIGINVAGVIVHEKIDDLLWSRRKRKYSKFK